MKPVGKPDAGNPHVRFDERGGETGRANETARFLDSTVHLWFQKSYRWHSPELSAAAFSFIVVPGTGWGD